MKKREKSAAKKTTVAIDAELHRLVRIAAAHRGVRLREVVNEAVREYLTRHPPEVSRKGIVPAGEDVVKGSVSGSG